jgi:hypothetical protein
VKQSKKIITDPVSVAKIKEIHNKIEKAHNAALRNSKYVLVEILKVKKCFNGKANMLLSYGHPYYLLTSKGIYDKIIKTQGLSPDIIKKSLTSLGISKNDIDINKSQINKIQQSLGD